MSPHWIEYFNAICNVFGLALLVWLIRDRRILAQANIALGKRIAEIESNNLHLHLQDKGPKS